MTIEDNGFGYSKENLKAVFSDGWQFKANMLQVPCVMYSLLNVFATAAIAPYSVTYLCPREGKGLGWACGYPRT